ncbi:MAG TPA: MBL fold metallo-hydrolase [Spirochaetota bacterium]|nr:MBL fold metallo-hydrolase [Spirochaetota bacterium]HPQ52240.1 MBL fold metallo-hydrolase [Spirochaetota bacterium]
MINTLIISGSIAGLIILIILMKLLKMTVGKKKAAKELSSISVKKLSPMGAVNSLSVMPLVDFYADDPSLKTEAGVSYLIKAGDTTILMDTGLNRKKEHPSPLLHNMKALNISPDDIDMIFISHPHLDHLGGMAEQKKRQFSISKGPVSLRSVNVYSPDVVSPSDFNPGPVVEKITNPKVIAEGIASIGIIPRSLFFLGYTREHSLAVNVKGKGIVLIVGCGHQTAERIIERARQLFDEPIYGIIGGLHFPVPDGRVMAGPLNIQNMFGNDRAPWNPINEDETMHAIQAIREIKPKLVSLSAHDSSDWAVEKFKEAFPQQYVDLLVGREIRI